MKKKVYNFCFSAEINEFRKIINFCSPFTTLLDQSCPLKILLDKYKNDEEPELGEMDFTYLYPFVEYNTCCYVEI